MDNKDNRSRSIKNLGLEYLDSADKVRLRAKKLELALKAKEINKNEMYNIHERIELLYTQYRDTKKIGEKLISYYNNTKSITPVLILDVKKPKNKTIISESNNLQNNKKVV